MKRTPSLTLRGLVPAMLSGSLTLVGCAFPRADALDDVIAQDASNDLAPSIDAHQDASADDAHTTDEAHDARGDSADDAVTSDAMSADAATCPADAGATLQVCGSACVNTANSPEHCGRCDNRCGLGTECVTGVCNLRCSPGTVRCETECIDPTSNPRFCNADNNCANFTRCPSGQRCTDGRCVANCARGSIVCDGRCVDPNTNRQLCGARGDCTGANRGTDCGGGVCADGVCLAMCPADTVACEGGCISPLNDRLRCGARGDCLGANAGTACASDQVCTNGRCTVGGCATGTIRCGSSCVAPESNREFCGAIGDCLGANAGARCAANEQCVGGTCLFTPAPESVLSGAVDDGMVVSANPLELSLGAPNPGTFYYTVDGSPPTPGAVNTLSASGTRVALAPLGLNMGATPGCSTLRWFVDYGASLGRELAPQLRQVCTRALSRDVALVANQTESPFNLASMDGIALESGGASGPLLVVRPGATVSLRFRLRAYPPTGQTHRALVILDEATRRTLLCESTSVVRDMVWTSAVRPSLQFAAPSAPGRYAVRWSQATGTGCALTATLPLRTIAVLIVR
jgi:hypothetical protein